MTRLYDDINKKENKDQPYATNILLLEPKYKEI